MFSWGFSLNFSQSSSWIPRNLWQRWLRIWRGIQCRMATECQQNGSHMLSVGWAGRWVASKLTLCLLFYSSDLCLLFIHLIWLLVLLLLLLLINATSTRVHGHIVEYPTHMFSPNNTTCVHIHNHWIFNIIVCCNRINVIGLWTVWLCHIHQFFIQN